MALDANIVERLVNSETDKRLQIAGGYWARKMKAAGDWTKLRIGMRWGSMRASAWTSPPKFYYGLCSGTATPPGASTVDHFYGIVNRNANWVYPSAGNLAVTANSNWFDGINIGSGSTLNSQNLSYSSGAAGSKNVDYGHSLLFLEITKGATWEIDCWATLYNNADVSLAEYEDQMSRITVGSPLIKTLTTYTPYAVDELTYGALDTVCFSWLGEGVGNAFEISDIAVKRLA